MSAVVFPGGKSIALLLDPDKAEKSHLDRVLDSAIRNRVDYIFAGGSITFNPVEDLIEYVKNKCRIPVVLFPGNLLHLSHKADFVLFLSLISGRNPELLIGNHVLAAPFLKEIRSMVIPAGYILINCGTKTSVEYISQTDAIPAGKIDIVVATALAGEMLGLRLIYLEGGSGAPIPVPPELIRAVKQNITIPLAAGGGIRNESQVADAFSAGADIVVLGNGVENQPELLAAACAVRNGFLQQKG